MKKVYQALYCSNVWRLVDFPKFLQYFRIAI